MSTDQRAIFAKNLKNLLKRNNKNQTNLTENLGVTSSTVSDWVSGKKYPRVDKMQAIADLFGVPISALREEQNGEIIPITGMVAVFGTIPAGVPAFAEQYIEDYIPTVLKNPEEYFCLRVKGRSMINAGIPDGCRVLLHKQHTAENGSIIACRIDGSDATLKRFRQDGKNVILMPENPDFDPIFLSADQFEDGSAEILGVVRQILIDVSC